MFKNSTTYAGCKRKKCATIFPDIESLLKKISRLRISFMVFFEKKMSLFMRFQNFLLKIIAYNSNGGFIFAMLSQERINTLKRIIFFCIVIYIPLIRNIQKFFICTFLLFIGTRSCEDVYSLFKECLGFW